MDKVIIAAFFLVIGAVVWAILPAPDAAVTTTAKTVTSRQSAVPTMGTSKLLDTRRIAQVRVPKKTEGEQEKTPATAATRKGKVKLKEKTDAPDTTHPDYDESPNAVIPKGAKRIPWPVATKGEFAKKNHVNEDAEPVEIHKIAPEDDPFPHFKTKAFKNSIRDYYGGLPAGGKLPDKVLAADVLPTSLMGSLHMPADTQLTMLGPHYTNDVRAYKVALAIPEDQSNVFGLSYVTPDGKNHRQYIRLNAEEN